MWSSLRSSQKHNESYLTIPEPTDVRDMHTVATTALINILYMDAP